MMLALTITLSEVTNKNTIFTHSSRVSEESLSNLACSEYPEGTEGSEGTEGYLKGKGWKTPAPAPVIGFQKYCSSPHTPPQGYF